MDLPEMNEKGLQELDRIRPTLKELSNASILIMRDIVSKHGDELKRWEEQWLNAKGITRDELRGRSLDMALELELYLQEHCPVYRTSYEQYGMLMASKIQEMRQRKKGGGRIDGD